MTQPSDFMLALYEARRPLIPLEARAEWASDAYVAGLIAADDLESLIGYKGTFSAEPARRRIARLG